MGEIVDFKKTQNEGNVGGKTGEIDFRTEVTVETAALAIPYYLYVEHDQVKADLIFKAMQDAAPDDRGVIGVRREVARAVNLSSPRKLAEALGKPLS